MSDLPPTFVSGFHDEQSARRLRYTRLGKTNMVVSNYSLGGAAFATFYGTATQEEIKSILVEGLRKGVNYIDTAPWYGQGRSERFIGEALKDVPRNAYYVATKVSRIALTRIVNRLTSLSSLGSAGSAGSATSPLLIRMKQF